MDSPTAADAGSIWLPGPRFPAASGEVRARGLIARLPVVGQFQIDTLPGRQRISRPDRPAQGLGEKSGYPPWLLSFKATQSPSVLKRRWQREGLLSACPNGGRFPSRERKIRGLEVLTASSRDQFRSQDSGGDEGDADRTVRAAQQPTPRSGGRRAQGLATDFWHGV